ncbi:MAG: vitamin B12-dependent ribonucleotide reductase [Candidatus Nanopelagicales bacterium]
MSVTTSAPAAEAFIHNTLGKEGLVIERLYTTAGVHPYDEVAWERRDVVQTNWKSGEVVFEQRGVEFPDFWSVNASTIVTTKYFRGAMGTEQREYSLRQLLDRVVLTYVKAGKEHGYFRTPADAEAFEHELTYMLLHQVFSFNSPVWFNVGTVSPQQVSACFILAVDDTMDSILNWYKEEGLIFKGGSGAGLNLSRIRSSKELLKSSGGTASGPVSFMRGADASAGTIKSGGATRRAAKMVVLDVDHPDIEEFIETKVREEDKIRVLRDAGYDMDLGGKDITSVQYQNANNSVRVSDLFMHAVENGEPFGLTARMDGHVIETIDAKGLFRTMTEAAWACADPGIQYDDTINDWHTNPETGRINASNPCFTADTRVHTDKGMIRFDDLIARANAGEQFAVYTHDATSPGAPAHVLHLTSPKAYLITGHNPIVRLRLSGGQEIRCTPSHRFWTTNRGYVEAQDLTEDDRLLPLDLEAPAVNASWSIIEAARVASTPSLGEHRDEMSFPEEWTADLAHYLGWLIGDGSVTSGISTIYGAADDRAEILPVHQQFLEQVNGGRPIKVSEQANGTAQLRLGRGAFRRYLLALGLHEAKGADKAVPTSIFEAPADVVAGFLRGLFDADGTAVRNDTKGSYVGLGSISARLLREVQQLLSTFGIGSRIYRSDAAAYDLRITGACLDRFVSRIGFGLTRKMAVAQDIVATRTPYSTDATVRLVERTDEGIELTYNLSEPRNHSYLANGMVVRNCSEYMSLDNSSCNLASLNLMTFLKDDDTFDSARFARAVEFVITAMDISICFADFPTEAIADTTRRYRQLGIGYANLGALLMATGLPYDSEAGRSFAAAISSLMTGTAYKRSAELAGIVGPYEGYARNIDGHKRVMRKHAAANDNVRHMTSLDGDVLKAANKAWADGNTIGEKNGWRNAQASVLAPTGTIGFMMDCDTTGIEPDFSLVKFKKLVGGGSMQIVNQTIPRALRRMGYAEETIEAIVEYIGEHGHVIDAPGLKAEHYPVFDCAMGVRSITPMGHVRMMAAVQPFISGAISKTVNMPETATVDEVEEIYFQGWKLGLKALAIYRDNCKVGQPLSDAKAKKVDGIVDATAEAVAAALAGQPTHHRLPKSRPSVTTSFSVAGAEGYMTAGSYPDDGLGEVFLKLGKQGSTLAGVMDAFSIAISIALQYGVPLEAFVSKFVNMRFEPAGMTDDPDIRISQSIMDYIFRRLALDYLPYDKRAGLGIFTADERAATVAATYGSAAPAASADLDVAIDEAVEQEVAEITEAPAPARAASTAHSSAELLEEITGTASDAPLCMTCGIKMRPAGSCYVCEGCGSTSGCS